MENNNKLNNEINSKFKSTNSFLVLLLILKFSNGFVVVVQYENRTHFGRIQLAS